MNGSSVAGNCSEISQLINRGSLSFACLNPTSSVLLNGVVPEFIDKEDDMWARDLFTLQSMTTLSIEFRFAIIPDNTGVGRIEVVLFQCPQCGIYVDSIDVIDDEAILGSTNLSLSSCDSLVRVCIEVDIQGVFPFLFVVFSSPASFTIAQAYIAEVTFYNSSSTSSVCPIPEEIVTTEITANTDEMTDETTTDSAMRSEAFIILTSITATLATVINHE